MARSPGTQSGAQRRKRRTRSPHPGVVLLAPSKDWHRTWRARYTDPDTGKQVKERLDPMAVPNKEARRDWAVKKSKALAKRRMELQAGAPRATGTPLRQAVERYFSAHPRLRPRTLDNYRQAAGKLVSHVAGLGITKADDLTRPHLLSFREAVAAERKRLHVKGTKRREAREVNEERSPHTVNRELQNVRTILGYLIELDLLPKLTTDDLRRGLRRLPTSTERVDYLTPADLRRLLQAALRHDDDTYEITREEHRGRRPVGSTTKYDPIAAFVATLLLTGMRLGEALALDWRQVDLEALDHDGRAVGEIHLDGATKTRRARTIDLEVSPALRRLLAALRLATDGKGRVFGHLTQGTVNAARKRLQAEYGAPEGFTWQALRRTCGTYLTNAPGIFGAASAYRSARQLGHSVAVAEAHYLGLARGIPREARDLETAMQVADLMETIIERQGAAEPKRRRKGAR